MADRIEDLRDWWDRTRRRRLKPQVRAVVGRVRPAGVEPVTGGPAAIPATPLEPEVTTTTPIGVGAAVLVAEAQERAVEAEVDPEEQPAAEAEPAPAPAEEERSAAEPEPGAVAEAEALAEDGTKLEVEADDIEAEAAESSGIEEVATEPWSTTPARVPDGTSADPFAPGWIADVVEETAVDGGVVADETAADDAGADWLITDPAAAADRPGVAWPAAAIAAHEGWGEDEGVAAIEPEAGGIDAPADEPMAPEPWTTVPVASADREDHVADWSGDATAAVVTAEMEVAPDEDDLDALDLADLPAIPADQEPVEGAGAIPELRWAAPGAAPWETPVAQASETEPEAAAEPEPAAAAAEPDAAAEPMVAPEDQAAEPEPEPAAEAAKPEAEPAAEPEPNAVAEPEPNAVAEPSPMEDTTPDPWLVAAAATIEVAEVPAETQVEAPTQDPWAGVTWSAAERPAPWSPGGSAPGDNGLDLDEVQRRWLGRGVRLVEGIGPGYGAQLEAVGIVSLQDLLLRGATRRGRQEIADSTGITGKLILRWVNNADLFRIRGVGTQYADLLEAAGVDTVVELALRRPDNLAARLATTNEIRRLVRQVPTEAQVADWVRQARELPRIVAY